MMKRLNKTMALVALTVVPVLSHADPVTNIPEVGAHYRALTVEKSINRQNVLSAYTKLDANCRIVTDRTNRNTPLLDFYWLNDRTSYEPLDSSVGSLIRGRLQVEPNGSRDMISVQLTDLKTLRHDLPDPRIVVSSHKNTNSKCEVDAEITMGPSDKNAVVAVSSVYLEMGMMGGVNAVTIIGKAKLSGRQISRRFAAVTGW